LLNPCIDKRLNRIENRGQYLDRFCALAANINLFVSIVDEFCLSEKACLLRTLRHNPHALRERHQSPPDGRAAPRAESEIMSYRYAQV
jgi:hypothetical protein